MQEDLPQSVPTSGCYRGESGVLALRDGYQRGNRDITREKTGRKGV